MMMSTRRMNMHLTRQALAKLYVVGLMFRVHVE
jgi:hypothetical protein